MDFDPRWEWIHVPTLEDPDLYVRGVCNHLELVAVLIVDGERVATLCRTCDKQLPVEVVVP
jgi:hypothetical protein